MALVNRNGCVRVSLLCQADSHWLPRELVPPLQKEIRYRLKMSLLHSVCLSMLTLKNENSQIRLTTDPIILNESQTGINTSQHSITPKIWFSKLYWSSTMNSKLHSQREQSSKFDQWSNLPNQRRHNNIRRIASRNPNYFPRGKWFE